MPRIERKRITVDRSAAATMDRRVRMRALAAAGYSSAQIAEEIGITKETSTRIAALENITIPADKALGRLRRHDPNRIIEVMALDAEQLTAGFNLIEFRDLDPSRLVEWLDRLCDAKAGLERLIARLRRQRKEVAYVKARR